MKKLLIPLFLFAASPIFANCRNTALEFVPARPGPGDVVAIRASGHCSDGCTPQVRIVRIDGRAIRLESSTLGMGCVLAPTPYSLTYSVGPLGPGTWEVVFLHDNVELARGTLTVDGVKPFEVLPSFGAQGTEVFLRGVPGCPGAKCGSNGVRFNGVEATSLRATNDGLFATVPGLTEGPVDVSVLSPDGSVFTSRAAFRYTTRFDAADYARVLFPSTFAGPGANGATWASENIISNDGPVPIATIPLMWFPFGIARSGPAPIPPRSMARMANNNTDVGALVLIPRDLMQFVDFASHIRDTSRTAENLGTEIRVVTEEQTAPKVRIVGVANEGRYRPRLRIYDIDGDERPVSVEVVSATGFRNVYETVRLRRSFVCITTPCEDAAYGILDLAGIPPGGLLEVIVRGSEGRRLWAFVTLTNNETNQVTTYTPQ